MGRRAFSDSFLTKRGVAIVLLAMVLETLTRLAGGESVTLVVVVVGSVVMFCLELWIWGS